MHLSSLSPSCLNNKEQTEGQIPWATWPVWKLPKVIYLPWTCLGGLVALIVQYKQYHELLANSLHRTCWSKMSKSNPDVLLLYFFLSLQSVDRPFLQMHSCSLKTAWTLVAIHYPNVTMEHALTHCGRKPTRTKTYKRHTLRVQDSSPQPQRPLRYPLRHSDTLTAIIYHPIQGTPQDLK